jgi:hypothetical protein
MQTNFTQTCVDYNLNEVYTSKSDLQKDRIPRSLGKLTALVRRCLRGNRYVGSWQLEGGQFVECDRGFFSCSGGRRPDGLQL